MTAQNNFEISAVSYEGLSVKTSTGEPATLAVVDARGNVLDASPDVARAAWNVSIRSYRNFLMGSGYLRVLSNPETSQ
ncbi:hypothetical protein WS67_15860 [Burkholderia singularis]|uniref:Uncharacterized protein n=2 Tax=Burkholderia singularis TaxID=1503053 RepID=A0A124P8U3_9BURK|nr:hypothetical protein WS67_15860 [Burkholderia singularis]